MNYYVHYISSSQTSVQTDIPAEHVSHDWGLTDQQRLRFNRILRRPGLTLSFDENDPLHLIQITTYEDLTY
jgi:hypothetical protein